MALDKVKVIFDSDGSGFIRGAEKVSEKANDLRGQLLGSLKTAIFATFSVEALKQFAEEFQKVVDTLDAARQATGANTTDLQVWEKQMNDLGGSLNDVTAIINRLASAREKALEDPEGKEASGFEKLGISNSTLIANDAPSLFKMLQARISETGTATGDLSNLMDVLGEKAVKNAAIFTQSFEDVQEQMRISGKLLEEDLIKRAKNLQEINEDVTLGDSLLGGKNGVGGLVTSMKEAWVVGKNIVQLFSQPIAWTTDALGLSENALGKIQESRQDTLTRMMLNGTGFSLAGLVGNGNLGGLTPAQSDEIFNRNRTKELNREAQLKRIEELQKKINEKEKTDEEKLLSMQKEQFKLLTEMEKLEKQKDKSDFLGKMEAYLRNVSKVKELEEKVTEEKQKQSEEKAKEQERQDKLVGDYMKKTKDSLFGAYQMSDSLVSTGNFLGTARSRLAEANQFEQTKLLQRIEENTRLFLTKNPSTTTVEQFPAL